MNTDLQCPCCPKDMRLVDKGQYPEYFCSSCDYVHYANPEGISAEDYEQSEKYQDYYTGKPPSLWYHKKALSILNQAAPQGRILDFGCYDGFFVRAMRDKGLDAYGCDWNRDAIGHGKSVFGLNDRLSRDPDGLYDAIVALEVIEHFTDPRDFFAAIEPHLAPDGMIVLSCPNKNAIYRPATDVPPHHFSRFSVGSLSQIVESHGFKTVKHVAEMSSFQMLRNYMGDRMRRQQTFQPQDSTDGTEDGKSAGAPAGAGRYQSLRQAANVVAEGANLALSPLDWALHAMGKRYLAQLIWAKRA